MSSGLSRRLQLGIVFGLCATGMASAQRTPSAGASSGFPAAGSVVKDCPECPELLVVPAGQFLMGSPPGEPDREHDEGPQHTVTIARPFAAGKYEVTFDEWDACVAGGGCARTADDGWGRGRRPMIRVSYEHAIGYTEWLSKKTGKPYRLLSEARQLSFVAPDIATGKYCWNGECRYCEIEYRRAPGAPVLAAPSCRVKGFEGMQVTKIAFEIKYNLGEALTNAPAAPAEANPTKG